MNKKRFALIALLVFSLACNFVTQALQPATPTPVPTFSPTATFTPLPLLPAYIPPGCENVPPATIPAATALVLPTPAIQANPDISARAQARIFEQVVEVIGRVYVYPDIANGADWSQVVSATRAKIEAGLETQAFYIEMQNMIAQLGDEHSYFASPVEVALSEAELAAASQYTGIGVYFLSQIEKGHGSVIAVFPDSPAEHSGILPHDAILEADGLPLVRDGDSYFFLMRGPECTAVRIKVQSPGQAPREIMLVRHAIQGGLPVEARLVPTEDGARIGYIMLPSFFDESIPGKVRQALEEFGELDGLILDNRMNGGGTDGITKQILAHFTSGNIGSFRSHEESRVFTIQPDPIHNSQSVPLVVLVGEDTVSFGEIFSGALKDSGRAQLVGQATLGNVEILHGYEFEDGSNLWIASETFDPTVSHANWELSGLVPDAVAYADWDTFTFETDPAIAAALALLGHR